MDDRTMLELSAKAAGMQWSTSQLVTHGGLWITYPSVKTYWNPLTDDGDALRLAVKLKLEVGVWFDTTRVESDEAESAVEKHGTDPYAATRRAITRAAAEIQLAKESK